MKEIFEFRVPERRARRHFRKDVGVNDGEDVRVIRISRDDPIFSKISQLSFYYDLFGKTFSYSQNVSRTFSSHEIESANLFLCKTVKQFHSAGELFDTIYDESTACVECRSGATQVGPFKLQQSVIPKSKDFSVSLGNELILSAKAVAIFKAEMITGLEFARIVNGKSGNETLRDWFQMVPMKTNLQIVPPTKFCTTPFDWDKNEYKCSKGDCLGLWISPIVSIKVPRDLTDVALTAQYQGLRSRVLRPERLLIVSPKFRRVCLEHKLKGFEFEVAHLAQ